MLTALLVALAVSIGVNIGCLAWHQIKIREYNRRLRKISELDMLLTAICSEAFMNRHAPVFNAWAQTMGTISVDVRSVRKDWSEG